MFGRDLLIMVRHMRVYYRENKNYVLKTNDIGKSSEIGSFFNILKYVSICVCAWCTRKKCKEMYQILMLRALVMRLQGALIYYIFFHFLIFYNTYAAFVKLGKINTLYNFKKLCSLCPYKNLHMNFYSSFIYACQNFEESKMSFIWLVNKLWYMQTMEYYSMLKRNKL